MPSRAVLGVPCIQLVEEGSRRPVEVGIQLVGSRPVGGAGSQHILPVGAAEQSPAVGDTHLEPLLPSTEVEPSLLSLMDLPWRALNSLKI